MFVSGEEHVGLPLEGQGSREEAVRDRDNRQIPNAIFPGRQRVWRLEDDDW